LGYKDVTPGTARMAEQVILKRTSSSVPGSPYAEGMSSASPGIDPAGTPTIAGSGEPATGKRVLLAKAAWLRAGWTAP